MKKSVPATHGATIKDTILVVSKNPDLADIRAHVLEAAGFHVVAAANQAAVREACEKKLKIDLLIIGYSVPPAEKRQVWQTAKDFCGTPILELYEDGQHELLETHSLFIHESHTPLDFLAAVQSILGVRLPEKSDS